MLQRRIDPMPDGSFVLRRDTLHLARVTVRQGGPMTIDVTFNTWTGGLARVSDHYLMVQLYEHDAHRQLIAIYDTRRYPVEFAD